MALKNKQQPDLANGANPEMEKYGVRTTAKKVRKNKLLLRITVIVLVILLLLLLGIAGCVTFANQAGRFTVSLDPDAIQQYGIMLTESPEIPKLDKNGNPIPDKNGKVVQSGVLIKGTAVENMDNITEEWLPEDIDGNYIGSHNGDANDDGKIDYIAYTFYLQNTGKETAKYNAAIDVLSSDLGADEAIRVKVYRNGEAVTYGKKPVKGTENNQYAKFGIDKFFVKDNKVMDMNISGFKPGTTDKYTVVVWLEGWDPECVDEIMGGEVKLSMTFHIIDEKAENKELV